MKSLKVNTLKLGDALWPEALKNITDCPGRLYWAGASPDNWLCLPRLAVVGSRKATIYGQSTTNRLTSDLAAQGIVIISGLAYGIDAAAHRAALSVGGRTIAVLGTGLDIIYPTSHDRLAQQILNNNGCLITEYSPGSATHQHNFIARNRLISGLSDAVLVVEATVNSGSLYTARFGLEQGKTVMAVPGNINSPNSQGCNNLIKSGALPVTDASDIFFALGVKVKPRSLTKAWRGTAVEEQLLKLISEGVTDQELLALNARLDAATVNSALTSLEINGMIRPSGGGQWTAC